MHKKWLYALLVALGCSVLPATAQEETAPETVLEVVDVDASLDAATEEPAVTVTAVDVWWGNRSISYGNYIKFDKFAGGCDHWCGVCAARNICCPVGCPCTDGCTCCANVWDKIFFDQNKSFLRADAVQEVQRVLEFLQRNPNKGAVIEGKANDSGSSARNQDLAVRRADAVKNWLVSNGIDPARILTRGTAEAASGSPQERIFGRRAVVESK